MARSGSSGKKKKPASGIVVEPLDVLQADVDDESPQVLGALIEKLLGAGALDAHLTPLLMKKNRPGTRIEVLCRVEESERFVRLLLLETSTLGVKARRVERHALARRMERVKLRGRTVRVKLALLDGRVIRAAPEFEDVKALAEASGRPLREVLDEAREAARVYIQARDGEDG